jgi:uncharacterized protein (UPF0264 family)
LYFVEFEVLLFLALESRKGTMLASAQNVLHRAVEPVERIVAAAIGFSGEGCGIGRRRATGSLIEEY